MRDKIKIKRSIGSNLTLVLGCLAFVIIGLYARHVEVTIYDHFPEGFVRFAGWLSIVFFGGGGLLAIISGGLWKPLAKVDRIGITVFGGFGMKQHIQWSNVEALKLKTQFLAANQKVVHVCIFAVDDSLVKAYGGKWGKKLGKKLTGWHTFPAMTIPTNVTKLSGDSILKILNDFKAQYDFGKF